MNSQFNKPKSFGEILDQTFRLSKNRFRDFFTILLILIGPLYVIQALVQLLAGASLFRGVGSGGSWYEGFLAEFDEGAATATTFAEDISLLIIGLATFILFPVAQAAILFAINRIRKNEAYTVGAVIKQAFSRFWPILGSSLLFGVILFGSMVVPIIVIGIVAFAGATTDLVTSIILTIGLFLAFFVGVALLLTRLSFFLAAVVFDEEVPGLRFSWRLTKKRTWKLFGLYVVFYLIIGIISFATEALFGIFLGSSVLFTLLVNLVTLFTTMLLSVGYAVMYFDLKIRHGAEDLKEMIDEYKEGE